MPQAPRVTTATSDAPAALAPSTAGPAIQPSASAGPAQLPVAAPAAPPAAPPAAMPATESWGPGAVLVVDDEPGMRNFLLKTLAPRLGLVQAAASAEEAQELMLRQRFDLLVLDITLPGKSGLDLLRELQAQGSLCEVVLITAFADLETAIEALRAGAGDFLLKPFRVAQVLSAVRRGLDRARLKRENWVLRRSLTQRTITADGLVGRSIVIKGLQAALRRVAAVDSTVLLTGESGTGKELAAMALHRQSHRAAAPFVPVNCATPMPERLAAELFGQRGAGGVQQDGLFVYAQGGTLFLDEISELPLALQAQLLRTLESGRLRPMGSEQELALDLRIVAATNRSLRAEVAAGRFRDDLYYRLQVVEIKLPRLAAHKEDIPDLVAHFNQTLAPQMGVAPIEVSDSEMQYLQQYDWPGNVRELRNLIERSLIVGGLNVSALYQSLPRPVLERSAKLAALSTAGAGLDAVTDLQTLERRHILAVLDSVQGDKTSAAQMLGISRRTLERRCADWAAS